MTGPALMCDDEAWLTRSMNGVSALRYYPKSKSNANPVLPKKRNADVCKFIGSSAPVGFYKDSTLVAGREFTISTSSKVKSAPGNLSTSTIYHIIFDILHQFISLLFCNTEQHIVFKCIYIRFTNRDKSEINFNFK